MDQKEQTKPKGSDNNKRLAALESGVSALAIALTANGVTVAEGADPIEAAIVAIKAHVSNNADLGRALEGCSAEVTRLSSTVAELEAKAAGATPGTDAAELEELRRRVAELEDENGELKTDVEELANAKNALANQLADEGKGTAPADPPAAEEPEPEEAPLVRGETARDVGPAFPRLTEIAIAELIADGGPFEVAFSNGDFEIVDFPAIPIAGVDLVRVDSSRYIVKQPIHIRGGAARSRIHGAGLLYAGEQVGYCTFEPVIGVDPGQERRFDRALIFG